MTSKILAIVLLMMVSVAVRAAEDAGVQLEQLDQRVQSLKSEMLELSTEITRVEQQIYPEQSTVKLFVAVKDAEIELVSSSVYLDGQLVGSHLYSDDENRALDSGGIQELYTGFVTSGEHQLEVRMIGSLAEQEVELSSTTNFDKDSGSSLIELTLVAGDQGQPALEMIAR